MVFVLLLGTVCRSMLALNSKDILGIVDFCSARSNFISLNEYQKQYFHDSRDHEYNYKFLVFMSEMKFVPLTKTNHFCVSFMLERLIYNTLYQYQIFMNVLSGVKKILINLITLLIELQSSLVRSSIACRCGSCVYVIGRVSLE